MFIKRSMRRDENENSTDRAMTYKCKQKGEAKACPSLPFTKAIERVVSAVSN
jgi:hypothetical protein